MKNLILFSTNGSTVFLVCFVLAILGVIFYFILRPVKPLTTEELKEIYREDNHEEASIVANVVEAVEENETKTQEKVQELLEEVREFKEEVKEELDIPPSTGTREDFILHVLLKNTKKVAINIVMNRYDYTEKLADGMIKEVIKDKKLKWDVKTMSYTRTEV